MRAPRGPAKKVRDFADGTRICNSCEQRLAIGLFHKDANGTAGHRSRCASCEGAHAKAWYAANSERQAAKEAARRRSDPELYRQREAERYERHREKRIAVATQFAHKRKMRMLAAEYDPTVTRATLRKQYGDACFYCLSVMEFGRYTHSTRPKNLATIEHVHPVSKGGTHTWDNVVLACLGCNMKKGASTLSISTTP